jgi:hypothetical protein
MDGENLSSGRGRNIARMGDVQRRRLQQALALMITIRVDGRAPPSGQIVVDEGPPIPFAGWLQLLGILSAALPEESASAGLAQGLGGQFDAGGHAELGEKV